MNERQAIHRRQEMGSSAFDAFVQREHASVQTAAEETINWQDEKDSWLDRLNELFTQVREYLKPYVDAGQIAIESSKIELNEEFIGPYEAPLMTIRIGSKTIKLEPVGTLLIGTKGRVDVVGPSARARLMLLDSKLTSLSQLIRVSVGIGKAPEPIPTTSASQISWVWRIVLRPPMREIKELNQDNFQNLLLEIANG